MKLTEMMRKTLREWGHPENEIDQIERATEVTTYERNGRDISEEDARRLLGTRVWLSGLSRSAFHWDAARIDRYGQTVSFDSRKLFY